MRYGIRREPVVRRVIYDWGLTVIVRNENEYLAATKENREPQGVGFPKQYVKPLSD